MSRKIIGNYNTYPSLSIYNIIKNLSKNEKLDLIYQVIQNKKGLLDVYVMIPLNDNQLNAVKQSPNTQSAI